MGRPTKSRTLAAWMNGELVGAWTLPTRGESTFTYEESWLRSPAFRSLSLSLPVDPYRRTVKGEGVTAFFDNLLPDSDVIRRRLQSKFKTASTEAFDLLTAVGRECVGAIQLLPPDEAPVGIATIEAQPLDDAGVERVLNNAVSAPGTFSNFGGDEDDLRISIAGTQEKTALLRHDGHWCRPLRSTPTTHIFKLPLGLVGNRQADMTTSVENEWLCAKILDAYHVPVAHCEIRVFGRQKTLVVERFDRRRHPEGTHWLRLPQEDFCQATGTPVFRKYEADGGPGMVQISEILAQSENRAADLRTLLKAQIIFWMLRATDGHAKNFSLFLLVGDRFRLTPLYDVLSTWPIIGEGPNLISRQRVKMAMAWYGKSRHYMAETIQRRHFDATALKCGVGPDARALVDELIENTPRVVTEVSTAMPANFPQHVADTILQGLQESADALAAQSISSRA